MKLFIMCLIVLFINVSCFGIVTEKDETDQMVFLRILYEDGNPVSIKYEILPGKVKKPKILNYNAGDLFFEITDNDGNIISEGKVWNQPAGSYEYVDDNGNLKNINVKSESAEITVRVNYDPKISKLNLFEVPESVSLKKNKSEFIQIAAFKINLK